MSWDSPEDPHFNAPPSCGLCGSGHPYDTSVPSVAWNEVIRAKGLPEYLCATCIIREFAKAGRSFTAELWSEEFHGLPIEVRISGESAKDIAAVCEQNNNLRGALSNILDAARNALDEVTRGEGPAA